MEVDATTIPNEKHIKIHPLAIVTISDHHTRIASGGSALPPSSPTIGLLFGQRTSDTISIVDAEELDPNTSTSGENAMVVTKIELHQKVFPLHHVVGWYRVSNEEEPSQEDLQRNQLEISQYCHGEKPVFLLMNAAMEMKKTGDLVDDDQLPLMVYETIGEKETAVFLNVNFELETFQPERIALEKVFKNAPKTQISKETNINEDMPKIKKSKKENKPEVLARPQSEFDEQLNSLQSGIQAMNARIRVLLDFLHKVEKGDVHRDGILLRNIEGLLQDLPLVYAALEEGTMSSLAKGNGSAPLRELENGYNDTILMSYLAAVAKTTKTIHLYSEKYRAACETSRRI